MSLCIIAAEFTRCQKLIKDESYFPNSRGFGNRFAANVNSYNFVLPLVIVNRLIIQFPVGILV